MTQGPRDRTHKVGTRDSLGPRGMGLPEGRRGSTATEDTLSLFPVAKVVRGLEVHYQEVDDRTKTANQAHQRGVVDTAEYAHEQKDDRRQKQQDRKSRALDEVVHAFPIVAGRRFGDSGPPIRRENRPRVPAQTKPRSITLEALDR